jgi:hypothetical protein
MQETPSCRTTPEHPLHQDFLDPRIADTGKTLVARASEHLRRCRIFIAAVNDCFAVKSELLPLLDCVFDFV